ncbi:PREDICTED: uncharacterized protein LOC109474278 [Branchiostoma belcheri]|uniref:Uncharacterized protein LOC109474278 n=1 Tax=Branchiostoma belcheri TaxID=7741 RepID=A0A6P4Z888_BRABE|nr:PREDICTED: uncharacterized protein LOC109474278 [Branchiostoma belcheri]
MTSYEYLTGNSSLRCRSKLEPFPPPWKPQRRGNDRQQRFVLDSIWAQFQRRRTRPAMSKYDSLLHPDAQAYFRSPIVRDVLKKTLKQVQASDMDEAEKSAVIQKMLMASGPKGSRLLQQSVVVDNLSEVPGWPSHPDLHYDPRKDQKAKGYFTLRGVQDHIQLTCSLHPGERELPTKMARRSGGFVPERTAEELQRLEQGFVLDSIAVSNISKDYSKAQPKLGPAIPPYNSQKDKNADSYFKFQWAPTVLKRSKQDKGGTSIEGPVIDRFHTYGGGHQYLSKRNQFGAGHSRELVDGHAQFMSDVKAMNGYHGPFGFRRNTPELRTRPSPFGLDPRSPTQ